MKYLFIIFALIFNCQSAFGQQLIAIVDLDKLIKEHPLNNRYDSIYNSFKNSLIDSFYSLQVEYNCKVDAVGWGHCPESITNNEAVLDSIINRELKELDDLGGRITNFQSEMNTKLTLLKGKDLELIKQEVVKDIKRFNKNNNYTFILDKSSVLFSEHQIELTDAILGEYKAK